VCISRNPSDRAFLSNASVQGGSQTTTIDAKFRIIQPGNANFTTPNTIDRPPFETGQNERPWTATANSQIHRLATASISLAEPAQVAEFGIRSTLGIQISNMCNFQAARSYSRVDGLACYDKDDFIIPDGKSMGTQIIESGTYSGPEYRFSFFRFGFRNAGSEAEYTYCSQVFGFRGNSSEPIYNYLRAEMPGISTYEFNFKPLSGWEVRMLQPDPCYVIDFRFSNVLSITSDGVRFTFNGFGIASNLDDFRLKALERPASGGLGYTELDQTSFADWFGRLAEIFVFPNVTSSATQPEHEIAYVNVIEPNTTVPLYDRLALLGMTIRSTPELRSLSQVSVYVNEGLQSTHDWPDVLYDVATNVDYGAGSEMSPLQIDKQSFDAMVPWCRNRLYFFDGAITAPLNVREWGREVSRHFLLDLVDLNGRWHLKPIANFDGPERIEGLLTHGNLFEGSDNFSYYAPADRVPPIVAVKWRQERMVSDIDTQGLFPTVREVTVREAGTPDNAPIMRIDLSDWCTSEKQAIDVGKWECRAKRLLTHVLSFKTTPRQLVAGPSMVFKVGMETVVYDQPANGSIGGDGTVSMTHPVGDGTFDVLMWRGAGTEIEAITITIVDGKVQGVANASFCLASSRRETQTYKVSRATFDDDGNLDVEAVYWPLTDSGVSRLVDGWDVASNWVIEGVIA
jgi:hypothetical protein